MIDLKKSYIYEHTKGKAHIIATSRRSTYGRGWSVLTEDEHGIFHKHYDDGENLSLAPDSPGDLVEVKQKKHMWLDVWQYDNGMFTAYKFDTRDEADEFAKSVKGHRFACKEIVVEEGEGL